LTKTPKLSERVPVSERVKDFLLSFTFTVCVPFALFAASGEDFFSRYDLMVDGRLRYYLAEDLDRDGLQDILVVHLRGPKQEPQRWLSIFWQTEDGFPTSPQQSFQVADEALILDVGEVDASPGLEILLLTPGGVEYYPQIGGRRYLTQPRKLLSSPSLFKVPQKANLPAWDFATSLLGKGWDELLIPQFDGIRLFTFKPDSGYRLLETLRIPVKADLTISSLGELRSPQVSYRPAQLRPWDINGDGRSDLLALLSSRLLIFLQSEEGTFPQQASADIDLPFARATKGQETAEIQRLDDLNGDGIIDLVVRPVWVTGKAFEVKTELHVYLGRKEAIQMGMLDSLFSSHPDQILPSAGVQAELEFADFDNDGRKDLVVSTFQLGFLRLARALLTKKMDIKMLFYRMGADDRYSKKPDLSRTITVKMGKGGRAGRGIFDMSGDFNGDGLRDLLTSGKRDELRIYFGDPQKILHADPGVTLSVPLPQMPGGRIEVVSLNGDNRSDIVLLYGRGVDQRKREGSLPALRVLLSQ